MTRITRLPLSIAMAASLGVVIGLARPHAQAKSIAVVVNPSNGEAGMTSAELCDTLQGERQRWADGKLIQVLVPPAGSDEWKLVVRAVCRTSESGFKRQVASSRAFGRASRPPQAVKGALEMKQRVAASARAIGFIAASELDSTVKALAVDGKPPTDAAYPIQERPAKERRPPSRPD